jgi:hypothetical protein
MDASAPSLRATQYISIQIKNQNGKIHDELRL